MFFDEETAISLSRWNVFRRFYSKEDGLSGTYFKKDFLQGLAQGDPASCCMWVIVLDMVLDECMPRALAYADDVIDICCENLAQVQEKANVWTTRVRIYGFVAQPAKQEYGVMQEKEALCG
jgi:hypothetical protein